MIDYLGLEGIFDAVASARDPVRPKPAPDIVELCLKRAGVAAAGAVYVGDSDTDRIAAEAAGVHFLGLGARVDHEHRIDHLAHLPEHLERRFGGVNGVRPTFRVERRASGALTGAAAGSLRVERRRARADGREPNFKRRSASTQATTTSWATTNEVGGAGDRCGSRSRDRSRTKNTVEAIVEVTATRKTVGNLR